MMCEYWTSWSPSWHQRRYLMRDMCSAQSWWKEAEWDSVATYRRTGMLTIPKLTTPFHMERGMVPVDLTLGQQDWSTARHYRPTSRRCMASIATPNPTTVTAIMA